MDDGATKVQEDESKRAECMGRWRHYWKWVWVGTTWTNRQRCSTCGKERVPERLQGKE